MSAEMLTALATLGTVFVISASAIAALIQLRHMRASNELEAVLALQHDFQSLQMQAALHYVQEQLPGRLEDEQYREELSALGYINVERHPELLVCNWFTQMGTFLKHGLITESTLMDLYARLVRYYWKVLSPAVAVMRRKRGDGQYAEFEYLALRANAWLAHNRSGVFPRGTARAPLDDPWRSTDEDADGGAFTLNGMARLEQPR
jgi:hypothetical protein